MTSAWRPAVFRELFPHPNTPSALLPNSPQLLSWKCIKCSYVWEARANIRNDVQQDSGCPNCLRQQIFAAPEHSQKTSTRGSLALVRPDIAAEWDVEKNDRRRGVTSLTIHTAQHDSDAVVWWKCQECDSSYRASIRLRTMIYESCREANHPYVSCPVCSIPARTGASRHLNKKIDQKRLRIKFQKERSATEPRTLTHQVDSAGTTFSAGQNDARDGNRSNLFEVIMKTAPNLLTELKAVAGETIDGLGEETKKQLLSSRNWLANGGHVSASWACCRCNFEFSATIRQRLVQGLSCPCCKGGTQSIPHRLGNSTTSAPRFRSVLDQRPDVAASILDSPRVATNGRGRSDASAISVTDPHKILTFKCRNCDKAHRTSIRERCFGTLYMAPNKGGALCPSCFINRARERRQGVLPEHVSDTQRSGRQRARASAQRAHGLGSYRYSAELRN